MFDVTSHVRFDEFVTLPYSPLFYVMLFYILLLYMIARELFKASKSIRSEFIALFRELIYLKSFVKALLYVSL